MIGERWIDKVIRERDKLQRDVDILRERLQIHPGGGDKIDELEQALRFQRHPLSLSEQEILEEKQSMKLELRSLRLKLDEEMALRKRDQDRIEELENKTSLSK